MTAVEIVQRCIEAFEGLQIPYVTVGAFSVNVYGSPRSTKDADFVVEFGSVSINAVVAALGDEFTLDPQMSFETITSTTRYRLRHRSTQFLIEMFLLSDDPHDQARFARRVFGRVGDRRAFVLTAEDLIITKLRWSRQGKRRKDADDVVNVLASQAGKLDLAYVRSWCLRHGTTDLFERLLSESTAE
jgi:hypothetical protein